MDNELLGQYLNEMSKLPITWFNLQDHNLIRSRL